ncbi:hypothetical protein [Methylococcus mesophilus]|uniref:hypothetical protein n=1 Tax=Methylococcus mesophilus TaxID=2993564 RepID=UPI00224B18E7|nr:hypothetical protein [Methylococcus mesophilus]UZR29079.1 hypothetical protein OOT43_00200 [Methylococcus mesophilus]
MDIDKLKDKLGSDFDPLKNYVDDLIGQRDAARKESIDGRKALKAEVEQLRALKANLFERLGLDPDADPADLPDVKGQAEAAKQFEARVKRLERELADKTQALGDATARHRQLQQQAGIAKALSVHEFVDRELVESYVSSRIDWEDETPFYRTDDGKRVPLDEGVKLIAQTKPHLLKAQGAGGSGFHNGGSGRAVNPWAKDTFNLTEQGRLLRDNPQQAQQLMAAAGVKPT